MYQSGFTISYTMVANNPPNLGVYNKKAYFLHWLQLSSHIIFIPGPGLQGQTLFGPCWAVAQEKISGGSK